MPTVISTSPLNFKTRAKFHQPSVDSVLIFQYKRNKAQPNGHRQKGEAEAGPPTSPSNPQGDVLRAAFYPAVLSVQRALQAHPACRPLIHQRPFQRSGQQPRQQLAATAQQQEAVGARHRSSTPQVSLVLLSQLFLIGTHIHIENWSFLVHVIRLKKFFSFQ